jgi:parallel beta-helix repeat protein
MVMGNTLYVGGSGPNNYTRIQDAINDATDGDTIFVYNGRYLEHLIIEKSITVVGESKYFTIIDGDEQEYDVILIKADGVTVQGFTIQDAYWGGTYLNYHNGIEIWTDYNIIRDNIIKNNQNGIQIGEEIKYEGHENNYSNYNVIEANQLIENHLSGVYVIYSAYNEIIKNTISENRYSGVSLSTENNQTKISQNIIRNQSQNGICMSGGSNNIATGNILEKNGRGVTICSGSHNAIIGNHIVGNKFGVIIDESSTNSIESNNIYNNTLNAFVVGFLWMFLAHRLLTNDRWFGQTWDENYWGSPYRNPKPILYGLALIVPTLLRFYIVHNLDQLFIPVVFLPFSRFERNPAQEPFDIPGMS